MRILQEHSRNRSYSSKSERFWVEFGLPPEGMGGGEDTGVFGYNEGVHFEAGQRRNVACGDLPQCRDQLRRPISSGVEVRRAVARRAKSTAAARAQEQQVQKGVADLSSDKAIHRTRAPPKTLRPAGKRKLASKMQRLPHRIAANAKRRPGLSGRLQR